MKAALVACLLIVPAAQAQTVECPKFYPWQDTPLAEIPYQHKGKGFVIKARLNGAGMFTGEINGQSELQGDRRKVKGGWDVQYGFVPGDVRWLACSYGGGNIIWWEQLDAKTTSCKLEVREATGGTAATAKLMCK